MPSGCNRRVAACLALLLLVPAACTKTDTAAQVDRSTAVTLTEASPKACPSPLPASYHISPPTDDVPQEVARYLGTWGNGRWGNFVVKSMCAVLVITKVFPDGAATAIYSWGSIQKHHPTADMDTKGGYRVVTGRITDGVLHLTRFPNGAEVKYWFDGDVLKGMYIRKKHAFGVELTRISD